MFLWFWSQSSYFRVGCITTKPPSQPQSTKSFFIQTRCHNMKKGARPTVSAKPVYHSDASVQTLQGSTRHHRHVRWIHISKEALSLLMYLIFTFSIVLNVLWIDTAYASLYVSWSSSRCNSHHSKSQKPSWPKSEPRPSFRFGIVTIL